MRNIPLCILVLLVCATLSVRAAAQGIPTGSTKVADKPDSAFSSFLAFLKAQARDSVMRADRDHRRIEARIEGSDEPIVFVFEAEGDSTLVSAQGTTGGMAALIFGLGAVQNWLDSRKPRGAPARKP